MLIYNPTFDLFNCVFRQLQILYHLGEEIAIDKLRILDFYLAFPNEIIRITLPEEIIYIRKYLRNEKNPYEQLSDQRRVFMKMEPYQIAAINYISSIGLIEKDLLMEGRIKRTKISYPQKLEEHIQLRNKENEQVINIVTKLIVMIQMNGPNGLKARTKLMEYKYDTI